MPRTYRIQYPGATYHIYARGNEKQDIYKDDYDRRKFIDILAGVKSKIEFDIFAYALMPNHYHILMSAQGKELSKIMHIINTKYAVYFNWKYKRVGHLFQDRYGSIVVGDEGYFLKLTKYMHLNPLGNVSNNNLASYPWSSLRDYLGRYGHRISEPGRALLMFDNDKAKARKRYVDFLLEDGRLTEEEIEQNMFSCMVIGTEEFSRQIYDGLKKIKASVPKKILRSNRAAPEKILKAVTSAFGVLPAELLKKRGKSNYARKAAIYLVYKHTVLSGGEIAAIFGNANQSNITRTIKSAQAELATNANFQSLITAVETRLK